MFSLPSITWHLTSICVDLMVFIPVTSSMWWLPGFPHEVSSFVWELTRILWGSPSKLCTHSTYHPCSFVCLYVCLQTYASHYKKCYYYFSGWSNCPWFGQAEFTLAGFSVLLAHFLSTSLAFWLKTVQIPGMLCPSPGISHFSKEPKFLTRKWYLEARI